MGLLSRSAALADELSSRELFESYDKESPRGLVLQPAGEIKAIPSTAQVSYGLEQLITSAVTTHPTVAMKRLELSAAGSLRQSARLQFFPTPSVSVDSLQGHQATVFRLSQPVWTGGKLTSDLTAAELKESRADAAIADAQFTLALKVITLYQSFLLQSGRIDSQRRGTEKLEQLVTMIERRVRSGVSAQIDLDLARSRLAQARSDLISLLSAQRTVVAQLSQVTGQPLRPEQIIREYFVDVINKASALRIDVPEEVGGSSPQPEPSLSLPSPNFAIGREPLPTVLDRALASSPALRLVNIDAQIARNEIAQTRSALWPTVAIRAEHQAGSFVGSQASGSRIYLSLQYTPGAGASIIPQAAAAASRAEAAEQVELSARRDVSDKVESEWLDFQSASSRIPELERTRVGSSDVLGSSFRLFVTGRRTWLDLLNSVRELMQTEQLEVDARTTAIGTSYRLALWAGKSMWASDGGSHE